MGCSRSAIADDEEELANAVDKTGMQRRGIQLYSVEASAVIKAARAGLSFEATLAAINEATALQVAQTKTREELAERKELERLIAKYGTTP